MACKVSGGAVAFDRTGFTEQRRRLCTPSKSLHCIDSNPINKKIEISRGNVHLSKGSWLISRQPHSYARPRKHPVLCYSMGSQSNESRECVRNSEDCKNLSSEQLENEQTGGCGTQVCDKVINAKISAYSIVYNDAKYVNERARNDIVLLSRGIRQLDDRARQDVAVLGLGILRLDARAREDTEKIDHGMKRKAACLHHITSILKDKAKSKLKRAADQHWSDGALEADLRRADFVVRRRAMEDAFMALKFVRNIHDMMASKLYQQPEKEGSFTINDTMGFITLEKNGNSLDLLARDVSTDRIAAIQDAYWSMASALSEADGIDYTDPEELEMLVSALIDLDAMDGKDSVSLLAECSSSPDVSTRQALANALAAAPSMWILGNAGMGALQRLAEDSNPAIAAAASKAIDELKLQWELEEGDSLRFLMNRISQETGDDSDSEENGDYQV
ncbi:uncharacterized protein A4U43_C01F31390 [Asparagus officinalis]|uniref:Senescence domain-containing protein n=1 Tax=Asparagus officinalis TaxID=4686 RepID=A0A5P1FX72_ASPOF|nr:uncharacterized protein LOC109829255 isoform X1 [Asparagus officinalis]ONK81641.1 uncharacterized protein A4U43_C01F31390 [Asparagus officinalis]